MLRGEDAREFPCIRVNKLEQLLKGSGGILRVGEVVACQIFIRLCIFFHNVRGGRFPKVCGEAAVSLNIEDVLAYRGEQGRRSTWVVLERRRSDDVRDWST